VKYDIINLLDYVKVKSEDEVLALLSSFSCPLNKDIEFFFKERAVSFARQGIAQTHLVTAVVADKNVLMGYFSLTLKTFSIPKASVSNTTFKRLSRYGKMSNNNSEIALPMPFIAQLGKNYTNKNNRYISGSALLECAFEMISIVQHIVGGKFMHLECEDHPSVVNFYKDNDFSRLFDRILKTSDPNNNSTYYVQMLRYSN
jgi:hypothetical protein